jgi:membrane-associated protein
MLTHLLAAVLSLSGWPAYLVVGGLALGESAAFVGLVLPGETALLYGGVLAGRGNLSLPLLLVVAAVAAVAGDSIGYELGQRVGPPLRSSRAGRWIGEPRWARAEQFLQRRGGPAVLLGRWVGLLRALVPTLAGMGRMPYRRFLPWNVVGGITWAGTIVLLGYGFAGSVTALVGAMTGAGMVLTVGTLAGLSYAVVHRWVRRRGLPLLAAVRGMVSAVIGLLLVRAAVLLVALAVAALVLDGVLDDAALLVR